MFWLRSALRYTGDVVYTNVSTLEPAESLPTRKATGQSACRRLGSTGTTKAHYRRVVYRCLVPRTAPIPLPFQQPYGSSIEATHLQTIPTRSLAERRSLSDARIGQGSCWLFTSILAPLSPGRHDPGWDACPNPKALWTHVVTRLGSKTQRPYSIGLLGYFQPQGNGHRTQIEGIYPKAKSAIPNIETLTTPYLGTVEPYGCFGLQGVQDLCCLFVPLAVSYALCTG